jgi:hypothetical protein
MTQTTTVPVDPASPDPDGRHAFDWLPGVWMVHNRKLADTLDPDCTEWVEFDAVQTARTMLHGYGNYDHLLVKSMPPHGHGYEGFSLRLFDPTEGVWRIWWSSTRFPGRLDPPVVGRFDNGVGTFYCDDDIGGRPMRVRYRWSRITGDSARWDQAFSYDGEKTWVPNWYSEHIRLSH